MGCCLFLKFPTRRSGLFTVFDAVSSGFSPGFLPNRLGTATQLRRNNTDASGLFRIRCVSNVQGLWVTPPVACRGFFAGAQQPHLGRNLCALSFSPGHRILFAHPTGGRRKRGRIALPPGRPSPVIHPEGLFVAATQPIDRSSIRRVDHTVDLVPGTPCPVWIVAPLSCRLVSPRDPLSPGIFAPPEE